MKTKHLLNLAAPIEQWTEASDSSNDNAPSLRRFSMIAYTGGPMILAGWAHPVVVDLAGMEIAGGQIKSRPILKDHNRSLIVGHTESIRIEGNQLLVSGVISGAGAVAKEIIESSRNGFPWQASLGAMSGQMEFVPKGKKAMANGREFAGPVHIARKSMLGEVSFVALGADDNTSASVAASRMHQTNSQHIVKEDDMKFTQWLEAKGFDPEALTETQTTNLQAMFEAEQAQPTGKEAEGGNGAGGDMDVIARIRAETAAETTRISAVRRICAGKHDVIEANAIAEGWDTNHTELEVLRAQRPTLTRGGVRKDADQAQSGRALEAAMCLSAGVPESQVGKWYDEKTMNAAVARDLQGAGLHTLIYETIHAAGDYVRPGRIDNETIRAAFAANGRMIQAAGGGGFSTVSLSGILSNVANKTMLAAYNAVESVVAQFSAETDVNDFKEVTRYRLTGNGVFEKVGPDGELKHAGLSEQAFKNKVETFGRMISLTRQMMINDDLGAFLQIPRLIGRMSALKREEAVFELLLSNPSNFFDAANKNFLAGADTALSIDALTKAEQVFLDQTDSEGKPVLLSPSVLLVPSSLKVSAQVLMTETRVNEVTDTNKPKPAVNPHAGKWNPVASPYLNAQGITGGSPKAWYLLANPADVAAIEIAYLRGKRTPTIESGETDFNTLGMQWRGYFDFGVAMQDHRAAVKSKGEV
ncbi:MAG: hypothetical protein JKX70_05590 [Phycisphaerales bacterium]|nr:hypothetical protein [Phycisphaerales bacterium]